MRFRTAIVALVLLGGLTAAVAGKWGVLYRADARASEAARRYGTAHPGWVSTWRLITHVGDSVPLIGLGLAVVVALMIGRRGFDAAVVTVTVVATHLVSLAIRLPVARPRPVDGFTATDSWAFPSGHTLHSAVAALLLVHLFGPQLGRRARWWLAAAVTVVAALIGVSRVMLLAHWPSDVLGGWLLALGCGLLSLTASDAMRRTRPRPGQEPRAPQRS